MKRFVIVLGLVNLIGYTALAETSIYTMEIEGVSAANSAACQRVAASIGVRLTQIAGVEIYSVQCAASGPVNGTFKVDVSYFGEAPVPDVVADDREYATYESAESCQADLAHQRQVLESETRLPILYAFCSREGGLRMRAIGDTPVRRRFFTALVDEIPAFSQIYNSAGLSDALKEVLVGAGVRVSRVSFDQSSLDLYYYAAEDLPFGFAHEPRFESEDLCMERAAGVKAAMEPNVSVLFQFCAGTDGLGDAARTLYTFGVQPDRIAPAVFGDLNLRLLQSPPDSFVSRRDCEGELDRILNVYRTRLNLPARTAFCSLNWIDYGRSFDILVFQ